MIEETNKNEEGALSRLRASIDAQRKQVELSLVVKMQMCLVPQITVESTVEFQLERFKQLCELVDVQYHNYLVRKQENSMEDFKIALSELCIAVNDMVTESCKIRFS